MSVEFSLNRETQHILDCFADLDVRRSVSEHRFGTGMAEMALMAMYDPQIRCCRAT